MPFTPDPQIQMLVIALTDVVEEMVTAKCGQLTKRDRSTLQRRIVKALKQFIQGAVPMERKQRGRR